ncbi:restriction endonuclease subunit S, partial [bacterium]|nr:restriction endonuclease subunit S [bacterium]
MRLKNAGFFISGYTPKSHLLCLKGNIPYFKVADMNTVGNEVYLSVTSAYLSGQCNKFYKKNTIVYPKNGGAIFTNKKRILSQDSVVDLNTGGYYPMPSLYLVYVYMFFNMIDFRKFYKGTAVPTIDMNKLEDLFFPLPPLAEQKRIVEALEALQPYIDEYDAKEAALTKLNADFPDLLKKSILQQAVMGKLVPQNENDEPAAVLLERIRAEKEALIKTGKLKKSKHESIIYRRDNSHYEKID